MSGQQSDEDMGGGCLPVLDAQPLWVLTEQAGRAVAERFFNDYLDLLPARSASIVAGLAAEDRGRTLDAVVSLRVTSAMAGALQMEESSRALERQLHVGDWSDAKTVREELSRNILRIVSEVQRQGRLSR
ncbi:hypothetical protein ASG92_20440 [Arthrobacter sp. Soil736]|uniref:hypothetical protein n=1 Tax=Arthrobacter sp. Soil736 TaxID=1736395 RepID=UPI0006F48B11|nr:hypothetical protein [Arthrobacter sp. Soil736]KRE61762.1 hypothetical protein ASG92_20440 [Arthrobacter sp. Soil736]